MSKQTKTLIVQYVPRRERSNTKKILDQFKSKIKNSTIQELDLAKETPDLFLNDNLMAYIQRDYLGQDLGPEQKKILSKMDAMTQQVKSADFVIVTFPTFNFSMPAVVKAWFDSIVLKGQTWNVENGNFVGLMQDKKALTIVSSGGSYSDGPMKSWEHSLSLATIVFQFMGFSQIKGILAEGMNTDEKTKSNNMAKAFDQVEKIASE